MEPSQFHTWRDLLQGAVTFPHGATASDACQTADVAAYIAGEKLLLTGTQRRSFPGELKAPKAEHQI